MQASNQAVVSLLLGPVVWALHFAITYAAQSTLCSFPDLDDPIVTVVTTATVIAMAVLAASLSRLVRGASHFFEHIAGFLVLLSAIGILWGAITVLLLPPCNALR
jgi:hypothetical protein